MPYTRPLITPCPVVFAGGTFKKEGAVGTDPDFLTQEEDMGGGGPRAHPRLAGKRESAVGPGAWKDINLSDGDRAGGEPLLFL